MDELSTHYCTYCGKQSLVWQVPQGDDRLRKICQQCGFVFYENPKTVVGAVVTHNEHFLLCKRAIEPQKGKWTFPSGFLENHESTQRGAQREAKEEACADIQIVRLLGVYSLIAINQVHIIYHAIMPDKHYGVSYESSEVALFEHNQIPWQDLAFPVIQWALDTYCCQCEKKQQWVDQRETSAWDPT